MARFDNRTAIVTGAGSGIGRATALRLAREGARVVMADTSEPGLVETENSLPDGSECLRRVVDVADESQVEALVKDTLASFGQIDVLCNTASLNLPGMKV